MEIIDLSKTDSIFNQFITEIRDENIQKDSMRFRKNCERMGEVFAYEISKRFNYRPIEVTTPLGISTINEIAEQPILSTILRAGLPMHQGFLNYFDKAENAFVSAYRKHHKDGSFDIELEYLASPSLTNRTVILSDPMIASGASIVITYKALLEKGTPKQLHIAALIASRQGLEYIKRYLPETTVIWVGAIDEELTAQSYIVPGLGDAGDLAYGSKE